MQVSLTDALHLEIKIFFVLKLSVEQVTYHESVIQLRDVIMLQLVVDVALAVDRFNLTELDKPLLIALLKHDLVAGLDVLCQRDGSIRSLRHIVNDDLEVFDFAFNLFYRLIIIYTAKNIVILRLLVDGLDIVEAGHK
jgi:hypothetical protein